MAYSDEVTAAARALYLKRYTPKEIQKSWGLTVRVLFITGQPNMSGIRSSVPKEWRR